MKFPTLIRKNKGRLNKHQRQEYFLKMDSLIANLTIEDQAKMQYVKRFIDRLPLPVLEKGDTITLGPMDNQLFQYLLFCLILEYEPPSLPKEVKLQI